MENGQSMGAPCIGLATGAGAGFLAPPGAPLQEPPRIPDYLVLKQIGCGSYGEVWLVRSVLGAFRAVKLVRRKTFWHEHPYEREFKGIQRFEPISRSHEGLVHILHVGRDEQAGYFYYVMELADADEPPRGQQNAPWNPPPERPNDGAGPSVPGLDPAALLTPETYAARTLGSELVRRGRLPLRECIQIGLRLTSALAHLHRHKLVHRDVKPANVIVVGGGPKLADIGLVAELAEARSYVGTEGFIPPEGPGTVQGDLYSLGKTLYELSTGKDRHAFPELPHDLAHRREFIALNPLLLKACQPDPRDRYASALAMHRDFQLLDCGESLKSVHATERRWAFVRNLLGPAAGWARGRVVRVRLKTETQPQPSRNPLTSNRQALEQFLLGKSSLNQSDAAGADRAIESFKRAIELDPRFGSAYAGLARAYLWKEKIVAPGEGWGRFADEAVQEALALNPELAEAYLTRGELFFTPRRAWDYRNAIRDQLRAIKLKATLVTPHEILAFVFYHCGLLEEARYELEKVLEVDTGNNLARSYMGQILLYIGNPEQALPFFNDLPRDSWLRGWEGGLCLYYLGRYREASDLLEEVLCSHPGEPGMTSVSAMVAAAMGDHQLAETRIQAARLRTGLVHSHHVTYQIGSAYALMNRPRQAVQHLRQSAGDGFPCYPFFKKDSNLEQLRQDPEFVSFLREQRRLWEQRRAEIRSLMAS